MTTLTIHDEITNLTMNKRKGKYFIRVNNQNEMIIKNVRVQKGKYGTEFIVNKKDGKYLEDLSNQIESKFLTKESKNLDKFNLVQYVFNFTCNHKIRVKEHKNYKATRLNYPHEYFDDEKPYTTDIKVEFFIVNFNENLYFQLKLKKIKFLEYIKKKNIKKDEKDENDEDMFFDN